MRIEVEEISVEFPLESRLEAALRRGPRHNLTALDRVTLKVESGESLGVVGESGCGKSTLARTIAGLQQPTRGSLRFDGGMVPDRRPPSLRRRVQMVFQDPGASLNPHLTVGKTLDLVLRHSGMSDRQNRTARATELLEMVGMRSSLLDARPGSLSGGQRQRVAIARALAVEPDVLVADEAVAALDVSVQASILALLNRIRRELGLTLVFITHDLSVVRQVCSRVIVVYLGRVVEDRPVEDLFRDPQHPYTQALLKAAPQLGTSKAAGTSALSGEPPSPTERPRGCNFRPRCPVAGPICAVEEPELRGPGKDQLAACHFAWPGDPATRSRGGETGGS